MQESVVVRNVALQIEQCEEKLSAQTRQVEDWRAFDERRALQFDALRRELHEAQERMQGCKSEPVREDELETASSGPETTGRYR